MFREKSEGVATGPATLIDCGLPGASSVTVTPPNKKPESGGAKVTVIVQLAPLASRMPHVLVWEKPWER